MARLERYNLGFTRFDGREDVLVNTNKKTNGERVKLTKTTSTVEEMHEHGIVPWTVWIDSGGIVTVYMADGHPIGVSVNLPPRGVRKWIKDMKRRIFKTEPQPLVHYSIPCGVQRRMALHACAVADGKSVSELSHEEQKSILSHVALVPSRLTVGACE